MEEDVCRNNLDMRGQKEAKRMREMVSDPEFISFGIPVRLCQILENYSQCSLDVQNVKLHPSSAPTVMENLKTSLKDLGNNWKWSNQNLKLAGIGSPKVAVEKMQNGSYLSSGSKIYAAS